MTVPLCDWCGEYRAAPDSTRCRLCEPGPSASPEQLAKRREEQAIARYYSSMQATKGIDGKPGASQRRWRGKSPGSYRGGRMR